MSLVALLRDRYRVSASASTVSDRRFTDSVIVHVVNSGRRPLTLRVLFLVARDGTRCEFPFSKQGPIRLMENQDHEFTLSLLDQDVHRCVAGGLMKTGLMDSRGKEWPVSGLTEIVVRNVRKLTAPIA